MFVTIRQTVDRTVYLISAGSLLAAVVAAFSPAGILAGVL